MIEQGAVRNLEQIQEEDHGVRPGRFFAMALVGLGGAAVVFAAVALNGRKTAAPAAADPLGELVMQKTTAKGAPQKPDLSPQDVTFPGILSDKESPTTALAAIRAPAPVTKKAGESVNIAAAPDSPDTRGTGRRVEPLNDSESRGTSRRFDGPRDDVAMPSQPEGAPAGDKLPAIPLPAKAVLDASPVVTKPRDALTKAAADSAAQAATGPMAPAGREGGYQLQISSFRNQQEANQFTEQLRVRGHKAHVSEAHVQGRGTWYRVRVGPFPSQQAAASYRSTFETKEHVVPFVVTPTGK